MLTALRYHYRRICKKALSGRLQFPGLVQTLREPHSFTNVYSVRAPKFVHSWEYWEQTIPDGYREIMHCTWARDLSGAGDAETHEVYWVRMTGPVRWIKRVDGVRVYG